MPPVGFEPTITEGERPQTYALDPAAAGIGTRQQHVRPKCLFDVVQHPEGFILIIYGIETAKFHVICHSFGQVHPGFLKAVQGWPEMWAPLAG